MKNILFGLILIVAFLGFLVGDKMSYGKNNRYEIVSANHKTYWIDKRTGKTKQLATDFNGINAWLQMESYSNNEVTATQNK